VPVEAGPGTVVAHGGARVSVRGDLLDVTERDSGIKGGCNERVPKRVQAGFLADPGSVGDPADDAGGAMPRPACRCLPHRASAPLLARSPLGYFDPTNLQGAWRCACFVVIIDTKVAVFSRIDFKVKNDRDPVGLSN
jgi:hypothetical protein